MNNNQISNNKYQDSSLDETLLRAYIGNNYDKITNKKFNFAAWFFNFCYLAYRKIYLPTFILLILLNILSKISYLTIILIFILPIIIGIFFNKCYVGYAKKEINKIKTNNSNLSNEQLINLVKKKEGGSSLSGMIIFLIIWLLFASILNLILPIRYKTSTLGNSSNTYVLEYSVPANLIPFTNDDEYKVYGNISGLKASCKYELIYNDSPFNVYMYEDEEELKSTLEKEYTMVKINSKNWYYKKDTNKLTYVFYDTDNKNLYTIDLSGDNQCLNYSDKISNSLKFIDSN